MKMIFCSKANENEFHKKSFALCVVLKERVFVTRKREKGKGKREKGKGRAQINKRTMITKRGVNARSKKTGNVKVTPPSKI